MSAAIAAVAVGAAGTFASMSAAGDAADANAAGIASASASTQAQLDFDMQRYEDQMGQVAELEAIFGPIRDNLATYYNDMSVEQIELRGREQIESEYQRSNENIDAMFSNNGMFNSGQRAGAQVTLEAAREETLGNNKLNAESKFNQEQMNWLSMGLQEKNVAQGLAANTANLVNNSYSNQADIATTGGINSANFDMMRAQSIGDLSNDIAGALSYTSQFGGATSFGSTNIRQAGGDTFLSFK